MRRFKNREYNDLSPEQIFTKIYKNGVWGKSTNPADQFYSGSGSRREEEISPYVQSVAGFLRSFESKPDVVDLGCGDFYIGAKIRIFCGRYIACDVVPGLISFNKRKFKDLSVEFKVMDIIEGDLPSGQVALIRQVLQHLSNHQMSKFVSRVSSNYKYLIVTEHLPSLEKFNANIDKLTGPGTRMGSVSGVILTSSPFNLRPKMEKRLCRVNSVDGGVLVTTLYGL